VQAGVQAGATAANAGYPVDKNQITSTTGFAQGIELQINILLTGVRVPANRSCRSFC
jgi:hypothetical protein